MKLPLLLLSLFTFSSVYAAIISGKITAPNGEPLPFASVLVKGTLKGVSANASGIYFIQLQPGNHVLVAQHIGYKPVEQSVSVGSEKLEVNFVLQEQQYDLGNVVISQGEDPAYQIIRNTISKKKDYENEIKKYEAEVYIKGHLKLRSFPDKFLGQKVDFEDGDTSKRKMIFLSESVARYSVNEPRRKVEVLSTKVSGNSDAFGLAAPQIFSFYQNNIQLGNLNPRGFVSPIATGALAFYQYRLEGTFFDNGKMVNRIKVTPRRKYEPLFNGYVNIIDEEWRIHSVQLVLYRENQMQFVDTLRIEQLYVPSKQGWVIKQQAIIPAIKMLGFDMHGSFVQVYDKFNFEPVFAPGFFDNTILKYFDSSNKKPIAYWDSIRPIPLLQDEQADYKKKDSLEQARKDPRYLDSLDRRRNRPNIMMLITNGQVFSREKRLFTTEIEALLDIVSYNTMEGAVINFAPRFTKRFSRTERKAISVTPTVRYGFSNQRWNGHLSATYSFGKKYASSVTLAGGRRVFQFDNNNSIFPRNNTLSTLYWERNHLKLYEAVFGRFGFSKGLGEGFTVGGNIQYQDRQQMLNTTNYKWRDFEDRTFTPNIPLEPHQAVQASISMTWQPGAKYIELPNRKINIGSKFPTLELAYTQGLKGIAGSDVDFGKWAAGVHDDLRMNLFGNLGYRVTAGGFLFVNKAYLPDYQHFLANQYNAASRYLHSFQLMPYYTFSNTEKLYTTAHLEYHLNGFLANKIPLFRKLNWFVVAGSNALYLNNGTYYTEVFAGLENILKVLRIDYVHSFTNHSIGSNSGIRFSVPFIAREE